MAESKRKAKAKAKDAEPEYLDDRETPSGAAANAGLEGDEYADAKSRVRHGVTAPADVKK